MFFALVFSLFFVFSHDPWDITPDNKPKGHKGHQKPLKSPTSPICVPSPPTPTGKTNTRARTQSNINPPSLVSSVSYPGPTSTIAGLTTSSPKSPVAEVSPYRRWSEATALIDPCGKVSNEWSFGVDFERSYMEMEEIGKWIIPS